MIRINRRFGQAADLGASHAHIVIGHFLRGLATLVGFRLRPDHAFTQIGARHGHVVKIKGFDFGAARAGANRHMGHTLVFDVVADSSYTVGVTQKFVFSDNFAFAFTFGDGRQLGCVQAIAEATALTNICSEFLFVSHDYASAPDTLLMTWMACSAEAVEF